MATAALPGITHSFRFSLVIVFFCTVFAGGALSAEGTTLRLKSFPPDASVRLFPSTADASSYPLTPDGRDGPWRIYLDLPHSSAIQLDAPGYQSLRIHLDSLSNSATPSLERPVVIEERLVPSSGPLVLVSEAPTGRSPKSAAFISETRVVVPLLRGEGSDIFEIVADRWGNTTVGHQGVLEPPERWAVESGFVEPLIIPEHDEIWISQMTTAEVHRFQRSTGRWEEALPSGGGWPKVLVADPRGAGVWVSNWKGRSVVLLDRESGEIKRSIPIAGEPRGILFTDDTTLWVCIFSSGEVVAIDIDSQRVLHRVGTAVGAARHIVRSPTDEYLYYSDMYHGTINVIDPQLGEIIRSRKVGINLNTIVFDPQGRYLYVSERGRNNRESYLLPGPEFGRIFVLDPTDLSTIQTLYGRHQPTGLAVSPSGDYLVATDFLDDNLAVYRVER